MTDPTNVIGEPNVPEPEFAEAQVIPEIIVDAKSGERIPVGAMEMIAMPDVQLDFQKVGTLDITPEQEAILARPFTDAEIEIRPDDGMLYVPWNRFADRLNEAFGRFKWGLIHQGSPLVKIEEKKILILQLFWLIVRGVTIAGTFGECTYWKNNAAGSYGDALEGAKSNALARVCKNMNVGDVLRLWQKEFTDPWRRTYAHQVLNEKNKRVWVKKPVEKDPLKEGKRLLILQLVPDFYPDASAINETMNTLNKKYTVETHTLLHRELVRDALKREKK